MRVGAVSRMVCWLLVRLDINLCNTVTVFWRVSTFFFIILKTKRNNKT